MRKIPKEKAFYFFTSTGNYAGKSASSVEGFLRKVKEIDSKSLESHLYRGDFEKWIREVWGYEELAEEISKIKKLNLNREQACAQIYNTVSNFLETRKSEKHRKKEKEERTDIREYLKKLPRAHRFLCGQHFCEFNQL